MLNNVGQATFYFLRTNRHLHRITEQEYLDHVEWAEAYQEYYSQELDTEEEW
jgi:hypothetical protein